MRRIWTALLAAFVIIMALLAVPASAAAGGTVSGVITDAAGHPLQGVTVFFGAFGPTTAADGSYSITVPSQQYSVMIGTVLPDGTKQYSVIGIWQVNVTGDMVENFTLPAVVPVNVAVQNASGGALVNTEIQTVTSIVTSNFPDGSTITWHGMPQQSVSDPPMKTDGTGHFAVSGLLGSTTALTAVVPGVFPWSGSVAVPSNPTTATLRLPPLHTMSGAFYDNTGHALSTGGASLSSTTFTTNNNASAPVSGGAYTIQAQDGTYGVDATLLSAPSAGFSSRIQGSETVSGGDTSLTASLLPTVPIRVHLQHADGSAATEASVTGTDSSGTVTSSATTPMTLTTHYGTTATPDDHGNTTTQSLAASPTTITVAEPNQNPITASITSPGVATDPNSPPDVTITVPGNGTPQQATATMSGVVTDDSGQPLSGVQVSLYSGTSTSTSATTAADGSWSAKVVPGNVAVGVRHDVALPGGTPGTVGPYLIVQASGTVTDNGTYSQDITLPSLDQFTVKVVDAADNPIQGVRTFGPVNTTIHRTMNGVDFSVSGFSNFGSQPSGADGTFTLYALDNSTASGAVQQADGYVSPVNLTFTTPATDPTIRLAWFGSVPSQGPVPGQVTISAAPGVTLTQLSSAPATTTPDGQSALVGNVSYEVSGITPGSTQDVTITLPTGSAPTNVFKVAGDGTTVDATGHSTITGNTIVMHLTDGGFGDADGVANGVIIDPLLPTVSMLKATRVQPATPGYPAAVNAGAPYTFKGVIQANGTALPGVRVRLLIRKLGGTAWGQIGSSVSDSNGILNVTFTPTKNSQMMWQFDGTAAYGASTSSGSLREVDVKPTISLMGVRGSIQLGTTTTLWGVMWPGLSGERVTLQKMVNGVAVSLPVTAIVKRQVLPTGVVGYGFVMPFRPTSRGTVVYRVITQKDNNYMATASGGARLTVW